MNEDRPQLVVFAGLARAIDWYDVSLQSILQDLGLAPVNRTQSMMLLHISNGVARPSEIAREMGTTRQNIHAMARHLLERRIIKLVPDPQDGRSKLYAFSEDAQALRQTVLQILAYLDGELTKCLGVATMQALGDTLNRDWGEHIVKAPPQLAKKGAA